MTKKRIYHNQNALKVRLRDEEKPITFVLGSAISRKKEGVGICDVQETSALIKDVISKRNRTFEYEEFLLENSLNDEYKSLFEFISSIQGQNGINDIIKKIVTDNIDLSTNKHRIPTAIDEFTSSIANGEYRVANIVTTNFDTLIEESFEEKNIKTNCFSMVSDSHLSEGHNDELNIFHIHGVWSKNDTMHSHSQLNVKREKLEGSLHELFLNTSVVIMAYGGWEDSFTRTLSNIVNFPNADYKIAWCFYPTSIETIEDSFEKWFDRLSPAIAQGRIQFFKGIDCSVFFKDENLVEVQKKK
ncbi:MULTISPECIES: SIR2 family protein [Pantoea]|uniref:SIR2-like domain-containing protein n=1 Tax=Candidatus Pantoea floridensis TaxID=1938870 RepID=A0A286BW22_9GAMM|nr:SIR2 family protein [Pantoea floridensis]PIF20831.1 SIR2-like protein [Enterobacteriaceae bacterium JKS000233]SOD38347.1 SIR2-like domain-containing protein [Pantoea floridensis]